MRKGKVPKVWKRADLIPVPKEAALKNCNQLRPISLTDIIMRIFEKCIHKTEIAHFIRDIIDSEHPQCYSLNQVSTFIIEMVGKWS